MNVEILIYVYLIVCAAMICFNIVCIFVFRHNDKRLDRYSATFIRHVQEQIGRPEIDASHRRYLEKKLRRIGNLMAFDQTLSQLYAQQPEAAQRYVEALSPVFIYLTLEYRRKNKLQAAYFPYIIKKYGLFRGQSISVLTQAMLDLVRENNLYCRENALQALYSIGDVRSVVDALRILDDGSHTHHAKLITDGLLSFAGNREQLEQALWQQFPRFSTGMQVAIMDYFRFSSGTQHERVLRLMTSQDTHDELRYSCIRYFGKFAYEPAFPYLLDFAGHSDAQRWEYAAIAATSLARYPGNKTVDTLKALLHNANWYVRFNASQSLHRLGLDYTDLMDVFDSGDRYAVEMMRYRLDQEKLMKKEAASL